MSGAAAQRSRYGFAHAPPLVTLALASVPRRVPDRARKSFGRRDYRERLVPIGRPNDLHGDVLVSVPRLRFMEDAA